MGSNRESERERIDWIEKGTEDSHKKDDLLVALNKHISELHEEKELLSLFSV